eukprot:1738629-Rhodomonas_salina.1
MSRTRSAPTPCRTTTPTRCPSLPHTCPATFRAVSATTTAQSRFPSRPPCAASAPPSAPRPRSAATQRRACSDTTARPPRSRISPARLARQRLAAKLCRKMRPQKIMPPHCLSWAWAARPSIVSVEAVDVYVGMYHAVIKLDEQELRTRAGRLKGTVGVEHTIDFFLGFANFKPATTTKILDSMAQQTDIHVEKTSFFSVSTHGTNDYSFLEYVNLRLVAVYKEDSDFSGADESDARTVRTNSSLAAHYVQVTFTMGSQYDINSNSDLIPLDSVRAGSGTFFDDAGMLHRCSEWGDSSFPEKDLFISRLGQACGPAAAMCTSPESVADHFVSFNIPLGIDFFPAPAQDLSSNVFVHLVVSAVDTDARAAMTLSLIHISEPTRPRLI